MTLYRLYLGGKRGETPIPRSEIEAYFETFVDQMLPGYTRLEGTGHWGKTRESSIIVEYLGDRGDNSRIEELAHVYAEKFGQESVLVLRSEVTADFVGAEERKAA